MQTLWHSLYYIMNSAGRQTPRRPVTAQRENQTCLRVWLNSCNVTACWIHCWRTDFPLQTASKTTRGSDNLSSNECYESMAHPGEGGGCPSCSPPPPTPRSEIKKKKKTHTFVGTVISKIFRDLLSSLNQPLYSLISSTLGY